MGLEAHTATNSDNTSPVDTVIILHTKILLCNFTSLACYSSDYNYQLLLNDIYNVTSFLPFIFIMVARVAAFHHMQT